MKIFVKISTLFILFLSLSLSAQQENAADDLIGNDAGPTESDVFLDDVVERTLNLESKALPYAPIREADIPWSKKIWRVLETREKINVHFRNPTRPFFTILVDKINDGTLTAFEDDAFTKQLTAEQVKDQLYKVDTFPYFDPETYEETIKIEESNINPEDIKRFRVKEIWYFDKVESRLKVRILGISPLQEVIDAETGVFKYEQPLFWIYYPELREHLTTEQVFSDFNDAFPMTWYDLFENRMFSSYIYKTSNALDYRLQDKFDDNSETYYMDILMESEKVKKELFNFEHDFWSY